MTGPKNSKTYEPKNRSSVKFLGSSVLSFLRFLVSTAEFARIRSAPKPREAFPDLPKQSPPREPRSSAGRRRFAREFAFPESPADQSPAKARRRPPKQCRAA